MPCWTIQENGLEIKNPDPETFVRMLKNLGFKVDQTEVDFRYGHFAAEKYEAGPLQYARVSIKAGQLKIEIRDGCRASMAEITKALKMGYSREIVGTAAKRYGWSVKQTDETHYQVVRRA
jgi:hypothetical protein